MLSLALFGVAVSTLWWMLHAWRTPVVLQETGFSGRSEQPDSSFSLIVPARHEPAVLAVVGHDDPETRAVAEAAARLHPDRIRVVIDHSWPKNKPKALNTALAECRGEIVGVFDAEDEVDRRLLRQVDTCFLRTGAHVVQGGVQLMNLRSSWWSLRNCLEYFFWFRSRLHLHARHRFIPLGGNTVFVRTAVLEAVGGWDPECLAEDCELGVRLSALGATVAELQQRMSSAEFTEWKAYQMLEPFGEWRADVRAALVSSVIANCLGQKADGGSFEVRDYMLDFSGSRAEERKSPEEIMRKAKQASAMLCEIYRARHPEDGRG